MATKQLEKIEVIRFETRYDNGTLDFLTDCVRSLCKSFSFIFKIIDQHFDDSDTQRYYEVYINTSSFLFEDYRHVVKTFILSNGLPLMHAETIELTENECIDLFENAFQADFQIVDKPLK